MIRYALRCEHDHEFEAWFSSSAAYDEQAAEGEVVCPACGSANVEKALMAPNLGPSTKHGKSTRPASRPEPAADAAEGATLARTPDMKQLRALARRLREHVTENADYVGDRFAEEARKIHYEETEARGIYGEATADEAEALQDEGIDFHPLPVLPEDQN